VSRAWKTHLHNEIGMKHDIHLHGDIGGDRDYRSEIEYPTIKVD
jgi:hypothetical protein